MDYTDSPEGQHELDRARYDNHTNSTVVWFSAGAASAVAAKLVLARDPAAYIVRCVIDTEHPDNWRFADDVAEWLGVEIVNLRSEKYRDPWDVWERRRFLNSPGGALCTVELKKKVRQRYTDTFADEPVQAFGYTVEERGRAERFIENNPEVIARFPLIEARLSKDDCFRILAAEGVRVPDVYRPPLSFPHANCLPCVKGGMGYWNRIREQMPEAFERMAALEEKIGATVLKGKSLRELHPGEGRDEPLELPECGLFCGQNDGTLAAALSAQPAATGEGEP
jgi:3'-phosphoadenosine 5'-phosphosulfate sulfotransferase (PAPS reductase)/FAD synthetase